jgi:hypothetical protein
MAVEQIKKHPFFYGVDWNSIRNIEAPFIPRLRSITDTSYFPTDELDQVPDEPAGGDTTGANKELAFLGYVVLDYGCCLLRTDVACFFSFLPIVTATRSRGSPFLRALSDSVVLSTGRPSAQRREWDDSFHHFCHCSILQYVTGPQGIATAG